MSDTFSPSIVINDIIVYVKIGHLPSERFTRQSLKVKLVIEYNSTPDACFSDNLDEAICYKKIIDSVHEFASKHEFHLIEKFGMALYDLIKGMIQQNKLAVFVTKFPEIDNFSGNVCFKIGDDIGR